MRRRRQGQFATLAMLIPMFAVPVMAVFGIPQFAPVVASPAGQQQPEWLTERSFSGIGHSQAHSPRSLNLVAAKSDQLDLFQPYPDAGAASLVGTRNLSAAEEAPDSGGAVNQPVSTESLTARSEVLDLLAPVERNRSAQHGVAVETELSRQHTDAIPDRVQTQGETSSAGQRLANGQTLRTRVAEQTDTRSWRSAVDRLNQLGIRTYRLSPTVGDGRYHFMCLVTSADDPRISRRFEAESHEPLGAVDRVLAQVEEWNRIR